jgi:hypothetical protein
MKLIEIGIVDSDEALIAFQKKFLVYQGTFMSCGGILWGTLCVLAKVPSPAFIPYAYVVITALNFWYFYKTKHFEFVRHVQTFVSLLLPFYFNGGWEVLSSQVQLCFGPCLRWPHQLLTLMPVPAFSGLSHLSYLR